MHIGTRMATAVSRPDQAAPASSSAPASADAASPDWRDGWFTFHVADVSDESAAAITKAGAWPAMVAFHRLLWKRQREAAKAGDDKRLSALKAGILTGEGIKGLARSIGADAKAMARQLNELQRLGVVEIARPPSNIVRDKAGRLVCRPVAKGLVQPVRIRFSAGDGHKRPGNRQGYARPLRVVGQRDGQGSDRPSRRRRSEGTSGTTPISLGNTSPSAVGQADGIGRPAEGPARLRCYTDEDIEYTRRKLAAELEARDAADRQRWAEEDAREAAEAARREQEASASSEPAPASPDAAEAANQLREAVAALPAASRRKAGRVARKMAAADDHADEEARRLVEIVNQARRQQGLAPPLDAEAFKAKAKAISGAARSKARRPSAAGREAVTA